MSDTTNTTTNPEHDTPEAPEMNDNSGDPRDLLVAQLGGSIVLLAAHGRPVADVVRAALAGEEGSR